MNGIPMDTHISQVVRVFDAMSQDAFVGHRFGVFLAVCHWLANRQMIGAAQHNLAVMIVVRLHRFRDIRHHQHQPALVIIKGMFACVLVMGKRHIVGHMLHPVLRSVLVQIVVAHNPRANLLVFIVNGALLRLADRIFAVTHRLVVLGRRRCDHLARGLMVLAFVKEAYFAVLFLSQRSATAELITGNNGTVPFAIWREIRWQE